MKTILAIALCALPLAACGHRDADPKVSRAWVRLPAVAGQPAAAYFEIDGGKADEQLIAVASAIAQRAEMHESMGGTTGTMAGMKPLAEVTVPAGGQVSFKPGGRHVMLIELEKVVVPGTAVPLRFGFASGRTAEAEAKTVSAGEDAPY